MRKFFTIILVFVGIFSVKAELVLKETFESGRLGDGWTIYSNVGSSQRWQVAESVSNGPKGNPKTISAYEYPGKHYMAGVPYMIGGKTYDEWLVSPEVTIPSTNKRNVISFETFYQDVNNNMTLRIIENNDTSKAVIIWQAKVKNEYDSTIEVNISKYSGKKVRFAWVLQREVISTFDGSAWGIDMITVETVINGVDLQPEEFYSPLEHGDKNMYTKGSEIPVKIRIINNGRTAAENYLVSYIFDGNTIIDTLPKIEAKGEIIYTFTKSIIVNEPSNAKTISVSTQSENDEVLNNNTAKIECFWVCDDPSAIFDFEKSAALVNGEWGKDGWVVYQEDQSTEYRISSIETAFSSSDYCWVVGTAGGTISSQNWGFLLAFCSSDFKDVTIACDRWLVLPKMHITSKPTFLRWDAATANTMASRATESYEILVSTKTNGISDFKKVHFVELEKLVNPNNSKDKPSTRYIDLSSYAGKDIYVAFRNVTSGNDRGWMLLDNIKFLGTAYGTDVKEVSKISSKIYPNPAKDFLNLESENLIKGIIVFNSLGQKVYENSNINNEVFTLNTQSFSNGLYMIKINTENGSAVEKVNIIK